MAKIRQRQVLLQTVLNHKYVITIKTWLLKNITIILIAILTFGYVNIF